jgi:hypothetical protein
MVRILRLFLFLLFFAVTLKAQSIDATAETDTTDYKVGDYINYRLELTYDKDIKVNIPSVKDSINTLEFIKADPVIHNESDSQVHDIYNFTFSKYDSGDVDIPGFQIPYSIPEKNVFSSVSVNPLTITVNTLPVNMSKDIQDVKAPLTIPLELWFVLLLVLIGLLIIAGGYFGYKYYKKKKSPDRMKKVVIKIPPYEIALSDLRALEDKKLWQAGKIKEYHSEITGIIRKYFEERFSFQALEMPSSEILDNLKNISEYGKVYDLTAKFFENADLVKFAKFEPMPTINEKMMEEAYQIVTETKPVKVEEEKPEVVDAE